VDVLLPEFERLVEGSAAQDGVETVKTGPHRTVYRLSLAGGCFYLKHFRIADAKALLQNFIRPSKAEIEWRAVRRIQQLGLPTFEAVALGRLSRGQIVHDSFLVSREIPLALPLDQFVSAEWAPNYGAPVAHGTERRQSELRQRLAAALGSLAGRLHGAAVAHSDFHAANILVRIFHDGSIGLWLIDLHKVCFKRRLSLHQRHANLALLHQFFAGKLTPSDRLRFYRSYRCELQRGDLHGGEIAVPDERAQIRSLEMALAAAAHHGWARADRAWKRGNRHVRKCDCSQVACRGLATLDASWLESVRDDPERMFRQNVVRWHKQTARHKVAEIRLSEDSNAPSERAFLKCIEQQSPWRRWLGRFRNSPVRRCWETGHALLRRGIDTPRPILFVERPAEGSQKNYILTEAVPETTGASEFFATHWPTLDARERRDWLERHSARFARQMRLMHDAGFDHRDLKFANLLVARELTDPRVWLLDLDGVRAWQCRLPDRRAAQNLTRIHLSAAVRSLFSRADGLRFLRCYLGERFAGEWKSWWRRIAGLAERKIAANRRRRRPLS
jgi:tRNA A-37 threonylcarbamoyl transferase component Bud32